MNVNKKIFYSNNKNNQKKNKKENNLKYNKQK